ncbi:MAG TPA: hemolysin family protein, partial [Candidatus Cloacimonadota bacterium]|nr:hemolysin family protein [Candidatus Cloacimonadota bacterium]
FLLSQAEPDPDEQPQLDMLEDALEFSEHVARNVMTPRKDIVAIASDSTLEEVVAIAKEEGFTRYPVYGRDLDDILGVLIIYDILKLDNTAGKTAGNILHQPYFAPENTDIDALLKDMQTKRKTMAIIVDSYGGTSGIVTIEDILEEIVGDIEDEYDEVEENPDVQEISSNTWLVQADVEIDYLADEYEIELPEGDYQTVAGLILDKLERIPQQGQFIEMPPYRLQVLQATNKRIIKVKIHKINDSEV